MKIIKKYAFAFYLGLSLGIVGYDITTWQFWVVIVPTLILTQLSFETRK